MEDRSSIEPVFWTARFRLLVAVYLGGIVSANAIAARLLQVGDVMVTVGALAIPLVYLTTDILNELYGPSTTRQVVWMGFFANVVLVAMTWLGGQMPHAGAGASVEAYEEVFRVTPRVAFASMVAYLCSSMLDVWSFHLIRRWTYGRHFWLRKNASTFFSQFIDSGLFVVIAFLGVLPWEILPAMIVGQWAVKIIAAPLGTPLTYLVLRFTRSE